MNKVIIVPDSFKGTMSSIEVSTIMKDCILRHYPKAQVHTLPVADGGEGTVDAFLFAAGGGEKREVFVSGPFFKKTQAFFGLIDGGNTAVIEMAAAAGLPLAAEAADPLSATTFGAGELIGAALDAGCKKIIMGLGGSATNDGGCGAAAALGAAFFDGEGKRFIPTGGSLSRIARIDLSGVDARLFDTERLCMCDIDNPLFGKTGAAHVFAPQKGADEKAVEILDEGLRHLAERAHSDLGAGSGEEAGSGAAGGMAYGMREFLGFSLKSGIETVLDNTGFNELIAGADCVFSGEGRFDSQSLRGKVVQGVALRTRSQAVPLIVVAGDIGEGIEAAYEMGVSAVFSINRLAREYQEVRHRAKLDLALTMDALLRLIKLSGRWGSA